MPFLPIYQLVHPLTQIVSGMAEYTMSLKAFVADVFGSIVLKFPRVAILMQSIM